MAYRDSSYSSGFKFRSKENINDFSAVLLSGPPGIGKTTAAHVIAKTNGYELLEFNASDVRSKKILEVRTQMQVFRIDGGSK
jgi:replication factor C subunit 1